MFHDVVDKKETIYHYKNDNFSKGQKSQYSKGVNSWFLSKNAEFYFTFFLNKMSLEIMFHYALDKKKLFRVKKKIYSAKNRNFPKGFTHDFCQKIKKFSFIFFRAKWA